jgi:hypothetical protein
MGKAHQEELEAGGVGSGGRSGEQGRILSTMASNISATMSGTNGGGEVNATMVSGEC